MSSDQISICICTYHRNSMLERLLHKISLQDTKNLFNYTIVVVDNDAAGPARELVNRIKEKLGLEIIYEIEPVRSIPAARNHAVKLASGNYIAIIDDDEFPSSDWLINLIQAIKRFDADGALGPVFPYFEQKAPHWLIKGKFCERPVYRTGTVLKWYQTRTGNVLLKRKVFDEYGLKFDLKLKTSSSDRAFFREAVRLGYKFVFVEEAPVYEIVPPERWKKSYYIKRSLAHGYNTYNYSIKGTTLLRQIVTAIKSLMALAIYILALPLGLILGAAWYVKYLERGAHHLGQLLARAGIELIKERNF